MKNLSRGACLLLIFNNQSFSTITFGYYPEIIAAVADKILDKLKKIEQKYPPRQEIDLESLADMLMVIFEGSFVLSQYSMKIKSSLNSFRNTTII